ncbi:hypothetical protein OS493_009031 [Desmophyllum pertusum]|uniref:Uncharacterized protein n=1 Tax=Desmophyllum pertusum TaxID=174260 RepID=A0A9X0D0Q9_9CNID|nr:hypothetical protein OS493_009031 [Desmophyllum pertusum]
MDANEERTKDEKGRRQYFKNVRKQQKKRRKERKKEGGNERSNREENVLANWLRKVAVKLQGAKNQLQCLWNLSTRLPLMLMKKMRLSRAVKRVIGKASCTATTVKQAEEMSLRRGAHSNTSACDNVKATNRDQVFAREGGSN